MTNQMGNPLSQRNKMREDFTGIFRMHLERNICRYNLSCSVTGLTSVPWLEFPGSFKTICLRLIHPLAEWMALILRSRGIKAEKWEGGDWPRSSPDLAPKQLPYLPIWDPTTATHKHSSLSLTAHSPLIPPQRQRLSLTYGLRLQPHNFLTNKQSMQLLPGKGKNEHMFPLPLPLACLENFSPTCWPYCNQLLLIYLLHGAESFLRS